MGSTIKKTGINNGSFEVTVKQNQSKKNDSAIILIVTTENDSVHITIHRDANTDGITESKVTDICGNEYSVVRIENQYWLARNFKCNKYDTSSEAYKNGMLSVPTAKTPFSFDDYSPYYVDVANNPKLDLSDPSFLLTKEQISNLGYLYSWAAAVGVADGYKQIESFTGNRQGICPNGWHIPNKAEWQSLKDYVEDNISKEDDTVGKLLKTTSGWSSGGWGTDVFSFSALPAGTSCGNDLAYAGYWTYFWTDSPVEDSRYAYAYARHISYDNDNMSEYYGSKFESYSVRCLKN